MEEQGHVILAEYEQGWAARAEQVRRNLELTKYILSSFFMNSYFRSQRMK